jgi:hypothetical protein
MIGLPAQARPLLDEAETGFTFSGGPKSGFLKKSCSFAPQWIRAVSDGKLCANRPGLAE